MNDKKADERRINTFETYVGYLTSGFEYFSGGFAQAVDQTKHKVDQHTACRALFDTSISFFK